MAPVPDFDKYCRLCSNKTTTRNRVSIFHSDDNHPDLYMKISKCLPVSITEFDFLPQSVCINCVNKVASYFEFREVTLTSESFLYDLYVKHNNAESRQNEFTRSSVDKFSNSQIQHPCEKQASEFVSCVIEDIESDDEIDSDNEPPIYEFDDEFVNALNSDQKNDNPKEKSPIPKGKSILKSKVQKSSQSVSLLKPMTKGTSLLKSNDSELGSASSTVMVPNIGSPDVKEENLMDSNSVPVSVKSELPGRSLLKPRSLLEKSDSSEVATEKNISASTESIKTLFQCPQCNLFFMPLAAAHHVCKKKKGKKGRPKYHEEPKQKIFNCTECGKDFPHKGRLTIHMRRHTGEKPFACTQCDKAYASQSSLYLHKEQVHEKNWKYVCSYCGRGFICRNRYECHVRKDHTGERPFQCSFCEKSYHRKQALQEHEEANHPSSPQQHTCETCGKSFRCVKHLKVHERIHKATLEERKRFKCNICDSSHTTNRSLNHHMLSHTGELPFECEKCKKRFRGKDGLRIHLLIHAGIKQFVCDVCGKGFALKNTLDCHIRTHTGEHPYQCDICKKSFTQKSSLNCHRKRHARHQELANQAM